MRKFRLKKCYPGSPELGSLLTQDIWGQYIDNCINVYYKKDIEPFEEFWEEIKEPKKEAINTSQCP